MSLREVKLQSLGDRLYGNPREEKKVKKEVKRDKEVKRSKNYKSNKK